MSTVIKDLGAVSAYAYAVEKGYTGTEAEFAELMADYAEVGQRAEDAAESASASASASAQSASQASASEQGCARAVLDAASAAAIARTRADEASGYAQTASSKASEASQSASQASGYAQTAETAKTDAQTAKTQAETARDNAVTAKIAAETAQGKAEDAQAAAESVAESIPSDYSQLSEDVSDLKEGLTVKADATDMLKAFPTDTASGSVASFADGADNIPLKSLIVNIDPVQDTSSGDPSPENICPISGWTQIDVNHSDADMTNPTTLTINLGQTVYGGKLDVLSGKLTVDRAMVDLGTLNWVYVSASGKLYAVLNSMARPGLLMCTAYPQSFASNVGEMPDKTIWNKGYAYNAKNIVVYDTAYTDAATFKSAMSGVQLVYELATPLEIQLTPHEVTALLGSNNVWADCGDTEVTYRADPTLYISRLTEPDADMIADANITSGQYFMVGNTLYKATANIASGATISPNVNCTRKSLSEALNELNA